MTRNRSRSKGFTLIELMIVVVIIGILAALAIPRFLQTTGRTKQTEAKSILKQIYVMEHTYRQEHEAYVVGTGAGPGQQLLLLHIEVMSSARYSYVIAGGNYTFTATATCIYPTGLDDDATQDIWEVNELGTLTSVSDDVLN